MLSESIFLNVWRSFYSPEAYRAAARARTFTCVAVLALAIALVCFAEALHMRVGMRGGAADLAGLFAGMPKVHIENGEARLEPPGRFVGELEGEPFLILDPDMPIEEALGAGQGLFVTRTHVLVRSKGRADTRNFALSAIGDRVISEADLIRWTRALFAWIPWILLPFMIAFSGVWRVLIAAAMAVIGIPIAGAFKATIDYAACFRIMTLASIPALLVGGIATVAGKDGWWPAWVGFACTLGYFVFGLASNRPAAAQGDVQFPPRLGS